MRLSRLGISDSACLVELNDPVHFNGEGHALISDLKLCIEAARKIAFQCQSCALILQGVGAHFCTGARLEENGPDHSGLSIHDALGHLNISSEVAMGLRKLPITTAAVHGKLIGGGVALSLAA